MPSYCNYVNASYNPHRPEVLIGTYVLPKGPLYNEMITALRSWNDRTRSSLELKKIGELYKYYDYRDLAAHPAMVLLPYMTATISFCEFYRMNIPLFFPSLDLIVQWEIEHKLLSARLYWPGHSLFIIYYWPGHSPLLKPGTRSHACICRMWHCCVQMYPSPRIPPIRFHRTNKMQNLRNTGSSMLNG